jgi:hypothetical protein
MPVPGGTFKTYEAIGRREDLASVIYDISPMERPFMSNIEQSRATNTFHEWQTDSLQSHTTANAVLEGDDATTNTATPTVRFGNYCQISDKVARVSGTERASDTAGRSDELSYQVAKRGRELVRDIEATLCGIQGANAGSAATPRALAGIGTWLWDNQIDIAASANAATTVTVASGAPTTAVTEASATAVTEQDLKDAIEAAWNDGGDIDLVLVGSHNKAVLSGFGGIATQYRDNQQIGPGVIIASADIYVSDFGQHRIVASRFTRASNVYCLDTEYWSVAYLRPIQRNALAKTGDSDRTQILAEYTLCSKEPKANAKVYPTTTS